MYSGLQDTIIMNPPTDNIMEEYLKSSICVVSSVFEGFSMVLIEAMACGLPVVSFDCPWGPRSIISDEEDGILVEKENVNCLADSLITLMQDINKRRRLSNNALNNVRRFEIEQIAPKWKSLFDSLL